jgi:general nucleoside transport system ATP-binding protein
VTGDSAGAPAATAGHAAPPRLRIERLTKRFGGLVANDAIDLEIRVGEIHCLLGENGAGKSTLSACLYGLYRPDGGRILIDGQPIASASPADAIRHGIGMVHQHFILVPPFTVLENIVVGTGAGGTWLDLKAAAARVRELCRGYGLTLDLDAPVAALSVGEQQWVEILKALYLGARLLILDEPTAVLTPQESEVLFRILRVMTGRGLSVLLISHKLNEVMQGDRVTVLRRGRAVATLATADTSTIALARLMVGREVDLRPRRPAATPGRTLLAVDDLWVRHDRGYPALRGISFEIRAGEILGLAGVAGNGQSELFETLVGVRQPDRGEIRLDGEALAGRRSRAGAAHRIGHVPEDRFKQGLVPAFSVAENLLLGRQRDPAFARHGLLRFDRLRQFARDSVAAFGIATPSIDSPTRTLSGGNAQKVILARELQQGGTLLLCNQPTRGLDVGVIEYVHRQLLAKRAEGYGILLASEELDDLLALSDRIMVMFRGEIMDVVEADDADITRIGLMMAGQHADAVPA